MRLYEIVYIFDSVLDEDLVNKKLDKFHKIIVGSDGEVIAVDHWGIRQMAYPVNKNKTGYYVVAQVNAGSEELPEFERVLKLDSDLMRHLLVLSEGEPTSGQSVMGDYSAPDDDDNKEEKSSDPIKDKEEEDSDADNNLSLQQSPPEFRGGRSRRRMDGPVIKLLNYKDVSTLSQFMTEQGKILPKRTTKVTASFQRKLGRAIKRARYLALIPYVRDHEV